MSANQNQSDVKGAQATKKDDPSKDSEEDPEDEPEEGETWEDESDDEEAGGSDDDETEDGEPSTGDGTGRSRKPRKKRRRVISALQEGKWQQMFQKLLQYHQKHGNCLVPNRYSKDASLGAWGRFSLLLFVDLELLLFMSPYTLSFYVFFLYLFFLEQ